MAIPARSEAKGIVRQANSLQLRVLHLVSTNGVTGSTQQTLFMPLLTKAPKQRVATEVVCLAPDAVPAAVLRQNGIPVHMVPLCRQRFSLAGFSQLVGLAREFRPDIIHAWGYTAQILAGWLRKRCGSPRVVMSAIGTTPAARAGFLEQRKLRAAARAAANADRMVFSSEAAAAAHRRIGFPEEGYAVIAPGVDPSRFKPDPVARRRVREQLSVPPNAFVIGMMAPFQPESDHVTFLKGIGELAKTQPNVHVLLAGHGVQKGNASLMALIGSGNLAARTQLLGEWTDSAGFFNACDVAASSAPTDAGRMNLVMAMLCGVACVATGVGEQGEVIGPCSVAIEAGSSAAVVRGITRVMEMPIERRTFLAQSSRKHALKNFAQIRSLQQYLQLYCQLLGRADQAEEMLPTPAEIELPVLMVQVLPPVMREATFKQPSDPNSQEATAKEAIEWRPVPVPQASAANSVEEQLVSDGDVLQIFESALLPRPDVVTAAAQAASVPKMEEAEDLLAPELLASNAGEEFRPRQVAAKATASAAPRAGRVSSAQNSAQNSAPNSAQNLAKIRPIRTAAPAAAGLTRPAASISNVRADTAGNASSTKITTAKTAAAPLPADNSADLDATLQLDVLTGALLGASAKN